MLSLLRGLLFGCPHRKLSRVFADRNEDGALYHYILCFSCGRHFPYNLNLMRVEAHRNQEPVIECQR